MVDEFRFDTRGRLAETIRPGGRSVRYSYDDEDRLVRLRFDGGSVEYGYEPGGNRQWMKDATGTEEYYRDALGVVTDVIRRHGPPHWIHFEHDAWNRITAVSIYSLDGAVKNGPAGPALAVLDRPLPTRAADWQERRRAAGGVAAGLANVKPEYHVGYQHDAQGRIVAMGTPAGWVVYRWSREGREVERTLPGGFKTTWSFNDYGRLARLAHVDAAGAALAEYRYFYADSDRLWRVEESSRGSLSTLEYRRDARGRTCEALPGADVSQPCRTDVMGRPEEAGGAALRWDANGLLAARAAGQQTADFRYDDRGLPIRATAPGLDLAFEWDGDGRVQSSTDRGRRRTYLADPTYATGEPWLEFDATGALAATRFCDAAAFEEIDAEGRVRYLLRDGFNSVRYVFDDAGAQISSTLAPAAGRQDAIKDRWTTAAIETGASYAIFDATPDGMRRYLALANSQLQDRLNSPDAVGRVYRARIGALLDGFFKAARGSASRVVLEPARADWSAAARDTKSGFPRRDGVYLPSQAEPLGPLVFPSLVASASGNVRRSGRVLDLPSIIEKAGLAGKPLQSIDCKLGCSGELERNIPALSRYARRGRRLPSIMAQSEYLGADSLRRLRESGYRVLEPPAPDLEARFPRPFQYHARGATPDPCIGSAAHFPGGVDSLDPRLETQETGGPHEPAWLPNEGTSFIPGDSGPLPPRFQLADPFPALEEETEQFESLSFGDSIANAGTLSGATYDPSSDRVVLAGDGRITPAAVGTADLAAALLLAYQPVPQYPRFSLDPADPKDPHGPWLKPVYLPDGLLAGSPFGRAMFQADWLMKQYSFGVIVDEDGSIRERQSLPGGLEDLFQISFRGGASGNSNKEDWTRLWIMPGELKILKSERAILFDATPLVVKAKRQVVDPNSPDGLRDDESAVDPAAQQFADAFTANYDLVAAASPAFARLREMAKLVELAHWLRELGAPVDLEWARREAMGRGGPARVPALSSQRSMGFVIGVRQEPDSETINVRTLHLFGGVSLRAEPKVLSGGGDRLRTIEDAAAGRNGAGDLRTATTPLGRQNAAPQGRSSKPVVVEFGEGQGTRGFDAAGRTQSWVFPDGARAEYLRGTQGRAEGMRITLPDSSQFARTGGDTPQWTATGTDGRQIVYRYDRLGRLSEIQAGGRTVAAYRYERNTIRVAAGDYTEEIELDATGGIAAIERSGPRIDGRRFTDRIERPASPAGNSPHADPPSLPADPAITSEGNRLEVSASEQGGFFSSPATAVEVRTTAPGDDILLPAGAGRLDAQGRLADATLARRLESDDAPERLIVQGSPAEARALDNRYGARTQVYFGTDAELAKINAGKMPLLEGPGDIAVYTPPAEAGVEDFNLLGSVRDVLGKMPFFTDNVPSPEAKVIALTAHESPEFDSVVERLGRDGVLRGKLVMLNTCHGALNAEWNARLIRESGAVGIRSFTQEISPLALKDVVIQYYRLLGDPELQGMPIEQVWRDAVARAIQDTEQQDLRREIEKLLDTVTQISEAMFPGKQCASG
jgi:YD repeat-containing protein